MLPNIIYNFRNENEWDRNQTRTLDPYSLLQSNTLNQINTIYGDNTILTGLEMQTMQDDMLKLTIKPGNCIKDKVLIQFKDNTVIFIDYKKEEFKELVKDSSIMVAVKYKYDKVIPAPIAKIEVIQEDEYDPDIHLGLYRIFFDSDGNLSEIVRLITPKDNIIYEQLLQELNSTATSAVYNVLGELGTEGIGALLGTYMRVKGTSISGDYPDKKYYMCCSVPKVNFNIETGTGEVWRNSLHIITTIEIENKYYQNEYVLKLNPETYVELVPEWNVYTHIITTDNKVNSYKKYTDIEIYEDTQYYYIYAWFKGETSDDDRYGVFGSIEVYETEFNSDRVNVCDIVEKEPSRLENLLFAVSSRITPHTPMIPTFKNDKSTRVNNSSLELTSEQLIRDDASIREVNPDRTNTIKSNTYINNCLIWNESNDGSGSGLDADLLDGREGKWYASQDNILDLEIRIQEKLDAIIEELAAVRKIAEDAIPQEAMNNPDGGENTSLYSGVAVLTNSNRKYLDDYNPDRVKSWTDEELEEHTILDSSPVSGVVPQTELYIDRMFGPSGVVFTDTNVNPTGTKRINCEGHFHATKVYNPAYKDIAEVFEANQDCNMVNCVRKIMALDTSSGLIRKCRPTDYAVVGVCSDTYGYLLGASEDDITQTGHLLPIGLTGTVWVDIENTLEPDVNYLGCLIGVGAAGKGRIMARTDKRYCVGLVVECNPDENAHRVKILLGNRWTV